MNFQTRGFVRNKQSASFSPQIDMADAARGLRRFEFVDPSFLLRAMLADLRVQMTGPKSFFRRRRHHEDFRENKSPLHIRTAATLGLAPPMQARKKTLAQ